MAGGDLGLAPADMARHIAWDVGAAGLARALARELGSPAILARFSRLVIDANRGEDDPTLLMRLYDGSVIPANRHAGEAEREIRACALHACELIAERSGTPPRVLDVALWNRGQEPRYKAIPRHRTRSVYY